jgi:hypothetical protein
MNSRQLFCSACDRPVRVLITDPAVPSGQASIPDAELVCLEVGARCTGNLCPLGAVIPGAMLTRLVRNGIPVETLETVPASCPACGRETEMILSGDGSAVCSLCGSLARWMVDHAAAL